MPSIATDAGGYVAVTWVRDYRRWWVYGGIPYQLKQRTGDRGITAEIWKSRSIPISTKIRLMKALVWPVATYGCESWTPGKNEESRRLDAFEMKGLGKILWVSWTAKKTNEWVLNKAGVEITAIDTVKARKLAYYGHIMKKRGSCLDNTTNNARCTLARKTTYDLDGQHQDVDRTLRGRVNQVWPTLGSRTAKNRTEQLQMQRGLCVCVTACMRICDSQPGLRHCGSLVGSV